MATLLAGEAGLGARALARSRALRLRAAGPSRPGPSRLTARSLAGARAAGSGDPARVLRARRARQRAPALDPFSARRGGDDVRSACATRGGDRRALHDPRPSQLWRRGRVRALGLAGGDLAPADGCAAGVRAPQAALVAPRGSRGARGPRSAAPRGAPGPECAPASRTPDR